MKALAWKENAVFSLKLKDDLYTLCQMRKSSVMEFFAIGAATDAWSGVDLNDVRILCQYIVAENRLKPLFSRQVGGSEVTPNGRDASRTMLSAIIEANDRYGADLVRLTEGFSALGAEVLKSHLHKVADWETIRDHELTGMQGSPEKVRARLIRYFETGIWWDEQKSFLFRGIRLPEPDEHVASCMHGEARRADDGGREADSLQRSDSVPVDEGAERNRGHELATYPLDAKLHATPSAVLQDLRPVFQTLLDDLVAGMPAPPEQALVPFRRAIVAINDVEEDIETVEREAILAIVYEIGEIVGLPADSRFAEEWRGDW